MVRGFYSLGSGMLTQSRVLTGISNNLANVETTGYKKKKVTESTFGKMLISRVNDNNTSSPIGEMNMITVADKTHTIHSEGNLKSTERPEDFAIQGEGFFGVQTQNGTVYTRNGSFNVDSEGYLSLQNVGRVIGRNGPIHVGTNNFTSDAQGNIFVGGQLEDKISIYNFNDYNNWKTAGEGMFVPAGENPQLMQNPNLMWKTLETSNVNVGREMTDALASQRNLQSCSQAVKMYDQTLSSAVTNIGRI